MSQEKRFDQTIVFYDAHSTQYAAETVDLDVSKIRDRFLNHIPQGSHILDLGCGSGRDSKFFIDRDYFVTAADASHKLAILASRFIGQSVKHLRFQDLNYMETFDGIWACASLLHCSKSDMNEVMPRIIRALKPNGIIYMSFKYGTDERLDERGRFFNDYTESDMTDLLAKYSQLQIVEIFTESKPLRNGTQVWLNVFVKKQAK